MRNTLNQFSEGQTHFGMPKGAKMSLALNEAKIGCYSIKFKTTSKYAPQEERNY